MSNTPRTDEVKNAYADMPYMDEAKALTVLCHELESELVRYELTLFSGYEVYNNLTEKQKNMVNHEMLSAVLDAFKRTFDSALPNVQAQR